jgi:formylglycine-generating enzyme required for sulfatase activity
MVGDIWEWTGDCLDNDYDRAPTDASAWIEGGECKTRIVRGGSWADDAGDIRSTAGARYAASSKTARLSFWLARTLNTR